MNDTAFRNIVLGKNFIDLFKLPYNVPKLTEKNKKNTSTPSCAIIKKHISKKCRSTCRVDSGC